MSTLRIYFSFFLRFPLKCDLSGVCECVFVSKYGYIQTERERERERKRAREIENARKFATLGQNVYLL